MTTEQLARQWFQRVWNDKDRAALWSLLHPEVSGTTESGAVHSREVFIRDHFEPFVAAFPDLRAELQQVMSDGDEAVVRWTATATHTGPLGTIPASGRRVRFTGSSWLRFEKGLLVRGQDNFNLDGLLQYLTGGPDLPSVWGPVGE